MVVDIVHILNPTIVSCTLNIYQLSNEKRTSSSGCMYKVIVHNFASEVLHVACTYEHILHIKDVYGSL